MKIQVRQGVFETNSSSVHTITMVNESDYEKWKNGELLYDRYVEGLVPLNEIENPDEYDEDNSDNYKRYLTEKEFFSWDYIEYETYSNSFTTPSGDTVIAFGYYGHD